MQVVWSRAAQARCICNCPSCLSTTNAIFRRATTATARRTVRVGNVFTVSLSSLAAGLAFADSKKKDDRRKQWDKVIGEARARLEATEIEQQNRLAALSDARVKELEDSDAARHDTVQARAIEEKEARNAQRSEGLVHGAPIPSEEVEALDAQESKGLSHWVPLHEDKVDTWLDVFHWTQEQHRIREASGFQDWKGPTLSLLQSLSEAELHQLLSNKRLLRHFYGGPDCNNLVDGPPKYPFSIKKTRILEWSIAKLVLKLSMYSLKYFSRRWEDPDCPTTSLLRQLLGEGTMQSKLDYMESQVASLHTDLRDASYYYSFERPPFPNYDDTVVEDLEQRTEIDTYLQCLPELMKQRMVFGDVISKICYLLLTARTPPRTYTYNLLLLRFSELDKDDQFHAVYISMRESVIRPNEISNNTILRHCTARGDRTLFICYLKHMQGRHRGLALAHPKLKIHPMLKDRYYIFGEHNQNAAEKARMNGQLYETLIVGAMQFLAGKWAMHFYRSMISEGWSPGFHILLAILRDCCRTLDWNVGIAVLEQIERTAEKANTLTYEWMLRLCQCCGQRNYFNQILIDGVRCGALPASILDLPDHAKDVDIAFLIECARALQPRKAIGSLEKTAERISARLGDKSPFLLENVFHDCKDQDELGRTIRYTERGWRARRALEKRLNDVSSDIQITVLQSRSSLAWNNKSSIKFWLSKRIRLLEQDRIQEATSIMNAWYGDVVEDKEAPKSWSKSSEDEDGKSDNPRDSSLTNGSSENEAGYVAHLQPGEHRRYRTVQWHPSNLHDLLPPEE